MFGRLVSEEIEAKVQASEAWEVYRGLELAKIVREAPPTFVSKIDVVEGDGAPGTILHIFFAPDSVHGVYSGLFAFSRLILFLAFPSYDGGFGLIPGSESHGAMGGVPCKEKYTVVDDVKRVKVAEVVEGGYLDLGFVFFRIRVEVIQKQGKEKECVTRATIEYEVKDELANNASLVSIQPFVAIMQLVADDLHQKHNTK